MKITTRIILGYALLFVVLAGLVAYQYLTIHRIQEMNKPLSGNSFESTLACLQAWEDLSLVEESVQKSFADPDSAEAFRENRENFERSLRDLKGSAISQEEQVEVERLQEIWHSFTANLNALQQNPLPAGAAFPDMLRDDLERLRTQMHSVLEAGKRSSASEAKKSSKAAETAVLVLWSVTSAAIVISMFICLLIYRSISKPLANLTEGTRALAEGKSFYRLDTSRRDELAQIAKDFNTITHRLKELETGTRPGDEPQRRTD
jgi:CHASE3 domain sensor protein